METGGQWGCPGEMHSTKKKAQLPSLASQAGYNSTLPKGAESVVLILVGGWYDTPVKCTAKKNLIPLNFARWKRKRHTTCTNDCTLSENEARRATKKKDALCSTSVLKSEGGHGAQTYTIFFVQLSFLRAACS